MREQENLEILAAVRMLLSREKSQRLTVWATLKEDAYETSFGDGYFAYVEEVFMTPTEAAVDIELEGDGGCYRWHIRRYDLKLLGDAIDIRPIPTEQEPTTLEVLATKLLLAGFL